MFTKRCSRLPLDRPLRATANVNIAGAFAVQGFRIFDSRNGLFVKEPGRQPAKTGRGIFTETIDNSQPVRYT